MPSPHIVVVASAYGADNVIKHGHAEIVPMAAAAGADGIEIRRELFHDPLCTTDAALRALATLICEHNLHAVYSAPASLFLENGQLNLAELGALLREAEALNARSLKLQFVDYSGDFDVADLRAVLATTKVALLVENGQLPTGGRIADFAHFFARCNAADVAVSMTFDIGNWRWTGEDPLQAAQQLASYVDYIHFKGVQGEGVRRFAAVPDAETLAYWNACLDVLPNEVPRGIEYPLPKGGMVAVARQHVLQLRQLQQVSTV
ncbi:sugar phosphate isomerase/epimerase [Glaciimonas sp. PCH181]|uniref:sugar phosphate isomerase/epimerase family protein n=1 Tax=Glaciimonas sp. PCH181 TaxID=2133943 RepID=UPI000D380ECC|nr:TIM barrel protein [Glaciimonas sp. PCH181]PUA18614.1 xylose isomerase [Glaciimonas sp. PCH181]